METGMQDAGAPDASGGTDVASAKAALRVRFDGLRRALPEVARAEAHAAIVRYALRLPALGAARLVHAYWPLVARGEVDVRPLVRALLDRGVRVALPAVQPGGALAHRLFEGEARLVPGPWGLREPPPDAPTVPPEAFDVVLVPALAFDRAGHRLGYGAGYYDRFLAEATGALRVGLVVSDALVPALPHAPHDVPVHVVVTERGEHACA